MLKSKRCGRCEGRLKDAYSFCPYCGCDLRNVNDNRDFGMLGKSDGIFGAPMIGGFGGMGISDKMFGSLFNTIMKSLEKQMKNMDVDEGAFEEMMPEIQRFPNGIKIKIGGPRVKQKEQREVRKSITEEQVKRMSKLPRGEAKSNVRRFSDRVIYELNAQGVDAVEDIFVSKLENGYEVKAIGKNKVYVNSLPVNLPLKKYYLKDKKLSIEFGLI
ncbi:MAG: hypothetical protein Q8P57_03665 [Candidatus Pacearchaeota archaeon]|nr:hypothetical protein [Candidatus Pacearchaeota archaeon]